MITIVEIIAILAVVVIGSFVGWVLAIQNSLDRQRRINKQRREIAQEIWRRYNHTDIELPDE